MPLFVIEDDLNADLMKLDNGMIGIGYFESKSLKSYK